MSDKEKVDFANLILQRLNYKYSVDSVSLFIEQVQKNAFNNQDGFDISLSMFAVNT